MPAFMNREQKLWDLMDRLNEIPKETSDGHADAESSGPKLLPRPPRRTYTDATHGHVGFLAGLNCALIFFSGHTPLSSGECLDYRWGPFLFRRTTSFLYWTQEEGVLQWIPTDGLKHWEP